ncbi:hypothetical protein ONZ45_g3791 [Pleurotus djamor]|nr:hypothetical protein ONZ45_g3791 [Pleurotus djamor]
MAANRLKGLLSQLLTSNKPLPSFDDLPPFNEMSGCAWDLWGPDDQLGTVNLLTDEVVHRAAVEEIRSGRSVCLNWPLNFPEKPMFNRKEPDILTKIRQPPGITRDDEIHINTQSGTQWDGLKHFGIVKHGVFYNNTSATDLPVGKVVFPDPMNINAESIKLGIQNWAQHGICGRGVLLDLVAFFTSSGKPLPYDPWSTHPITVAELEACAKFQGTSFRQGDILLLRCWPVPPDVPHMHQTLLGLWGMPIGEFFDLEKLSQVCAETKRYSFFFSSWPLNILGGCASPPNAAALF